jgi:exodeoxyribonuclease V gamma subunit
MLIIHRAERADVLVQALADLLVGGGPLAATAAAAYPAPAGPGAHIRATGADIPGAGAEIFRAAPGPPDPFSPELVAVPTRGIERWLSQQLAAHLGARPGRADGVCANVAFPSPGRLVAESLALASGIAPEQDPWQPDRLVWPLIAVAEASLEEDWLEPLTRHLREDGSRHRYARLSRIARLFAEYSHYRPELVLAWARGESGGVDPSHPASWQPELWRRLRDAVGVMSVAERLEDACARLVQTPEIVSLPAHLTVFGLTRMPGTHLQVLKALGAARDVHLMLLHPSPRMWERAAAGATEREAKENRLLASWGRDARGLQELLLATGADAVIHHPLPEQAVTSLLEAVQADVRADRPAPGLPLREGESDRRVELSPLDRSISVHACHGRARQVEVLREAILHRLADDTTLEPRDIIVMCPDIEAFAPLIEASFGAGRPEGDRGDRAAGRDRAVGGAERAAGGAERAVGESATGPSLRVRLADRSLRRTTPILALVSRLLELAGGRVTASQVLDLADTTPVRARFGFDDDQLALARGWVAEAGIHWGFDAAHREPYRLSEVEAGTWAAGLKRLLLGVALAPEADALTNGVLPVAEIQSSEIELLGRVCELVDRLQEAVDQLARPQAIGSWASAIRDAADRLALTAPAEAWQRQQLDEILAEVVTAGGDTAVELSPPELRTLLAHRLEGRPTRANFRSGHLTFCTLMPMRSVPHRVVCLLGLDDGSFPRQPPRDGDNLLLSDRRPGDRDPRTEDRQLLLDALLAARDALIITYSGNDERTNAPLPPAVPVGELLDAIDASARTPHGRARDLVVIHHPLQAFDPRNFLSAGAEPARAAAHGPWSFDAAAMGGARALTLPRTEPPPFLAEPLEPSPGADLVTLEELVSFLQRPVRAFLRQRLGISLQRDEDVVQDALPIALDALARWSVGQRLLEARLDGTAARDAVLAEIARGGLPPGELARPVLEELWPGVEALVAVAERQRGGQESRTLATNLVFDDGTRLTGSVAEVRGHVLVSVSYSRLHPRHRLASWARLLALSAAHPDIPFESITIGRGQESSVTVARVPQLGPTPELRHRTATAELKALIALRAEGLRVPLPVPCKTAHSYAAATRRGLDDPIEAANEVWGSRFGYTGEDAEPEHQLALPVTLDIDRLGALAVRVWDPLLAREVIE